jgi:hypothetical protein
MPARSLPIVVSDRLIASLQEHALPGVELSRNNDGRYLRITTSESIFLFSGFGLSRFLAPSPQRFGRAVWAIVHSCAVPPTSADGCFDWSTGWKGVDVMADRQRIIVTLRGKDRRLTLSPIDISDQQF